MHPSLTEETLTERTLAGSSAAGGLLPPGHVNQLVAAERSRGEGLLQRHFLEDLGQEVLAAVVLQDKCMEQRGTSDSG